jgi:RNase P/RNase MRP subunit POP5
VKRRYLALKIDSTGSPSTEELINTVWTAITRLYGEYGASRAGFVLIQHDVDRKLSIVRVNNAAVDAVRTAIASITQMGDKPAAMHVLAVSGTMKALGNSLKNIL